ncbi:MAG: ABC transporter permease, partial [Verrucomicrobiales bacterium]|nr:ABC transporter permease [Verrucomicrobiales bacterium]
ALAEGADGWGVLDSNPGQGVVPGVVDQNTAMWALKMGIGDDLHYRDPRGGVVKVRIVGMLAGSMLQGRVIISAGHFEELFPGSDGYRAFLIDVEGDEERAGEVAGALSKRMRNRGIEVMGAAQRLDEFNVVQNTYLSIFTVLGGLGVLLGTVGLAVVVARNVVERRGELGVMRAVGFSKGQLAKLVVGEHWFLHVSGVVSGAVAAMLAVWPTLSAPGAGLPVGLIAGLVAGVLVAGVCFCWLAAVLALRAPLMDSIRSE